MKNNVTVIMKQFTEKRTLGKYLYTSRTAAVMTVSRKYGTHRMKVAPKILIAKPHRHRPQGKTQMTFWRWKFMKIKSRLMCRFFFCNGDEHFL